uniref:Uncharacterized protein n=1 Tax=Sphaerodactylus townsendi TaxID=933632 RepID=A0ACB8F8Z0_9SAUR
MKNIRSMRGCRVVSLARKGGQWKNADHEKEIWNVPTVEMGTLSDKNNALTTWCLDSDAVSLNACWTTRKQEKCNGNGNGPNVYELWRRIGAIDSAETTGVVCISVIGNKCLNDERQRPLESKMLQSQSILPTWELRGYTSDCCEELSGDGLPQ